MTWRLTGQDHAGRIRASVQHLMPLAGGDFDAFTGLHYEVLMFDFHGQFAFQNEEELTCTRV
jgi:hypothetical protein